ncbi:hypothetical protein BJY04DRAFT_196639 [Aspergillus karnatakaensis]|uniref:uncharacterized protein n=1 Tax=Aspergillus karnatakaensis TaxID=1810916 RepID=UPI003CCCCF49
MLTLRDGTQVPFTDTRREQARVWQRFDPATVVLPQGWTREEGYRPLPVSVIWHRDKGIPMRDGKILYADIFRPENLNLTPLPAIISYSPYGKTDKGLWRLPFPSRLQLTGERDP